MVNHSLTNQQKSSLEPRIWFITHNKIPTICYIAIIPNLLWTDLEENVRFAWSRNKVGGQKGKGRLPRRTSATWKVSFASRFWSFRPSCDWPLRSFDGSRLMTRWVDGRSVLLAASASPSRPCRTESSKLWSWFHTKTISIRCWQSQLGRIDKNGDQRPNGKKH